MSYPLPWSPPKPSTITVASPDRADTSDVPRHSVPGGYGSPFGWETQTLAANDTVFHGIAEVMEALLMGTGADLFGDLTYTHALTNEQNPPLDPQLAIYDSVQALLSRAIVKMGKTGPTNVGPASADLAYGGDPAAWIRLATGMPSLVTT